MGKSMDRHSLWFVGGVYEYMEIHGQALTPFRYAAFRIVTA
jgi:hypothetical protein